MDRFRILYLAAVCFVYRVTGQGPDTLQANEFSLDPSVFLFPLDHETTTQSSLSNTDNVKNHTDKNIKTEPNLEKSTPGNSNASDPMGSVADFADLFGINFGLFGNNQGTAGTSDSNVVPLDALDKALDQVGTIADNNNSLSRDPFATDFFNFLNSDLSDPTGSGKHDSHSSASGATNRGMSDTQPEVPVPSTVDKSGTAIDSSGTLSTATSDISPFSTTVDPFFDIPVFGDIGTENSVITNDNTNTDKPPTSQSKQTLDTTGGGAQDLLFSDNPFFTNSETSSPAPNIQETTPANTVDNSNQFNIDTKPSPPSPPPQNPFAFPRMPFNPFQDQPSNPFQILPTGMPQVMPNQAQQGNTAQAAFPTGSSPFQPNFPSPNSQQDITQPNQADGNAQITENQRNFLPLAENLLSQVQSLVNNMKTQRGQTESSAMGRPQEVCENGRPRIGCDPSPCIITSCVNILNARCEPTCHECRARFFIGEKEVTDICQIYHYPRQNSDGGPQMPSEANIRQADTMGQLPERGHTTEVLRGMPVDSQIIPGPDGRPILVQNTNTRNFMRIPPRDSFRRIPVGIPDSRLQEILPGRFPPDSPGINIQEQRRNVLRSFNRRPGRPDPPGIPFPPRGIPFLARVNPSNPPVDVVLRRGGNGARSQMAEVGPPQPRERPPFDWPTALSGRTVSFSGDRDININQEQPPAAGNQQQQQQTATSPQLQPSPFLPFPDPRIIASFRRGQALARQMRQIDRPTTFQPGQNRFLQSSLTRSQRPDGAPRNTAQQSTNTSPVSGDTSRSRSRQPVDPGMLNAFRRFVAAQENARPRRRFPGSSF